MGVNLGTNNNVGDNNVKVDEELNKHFKSNENVMNNNNGINITFGTINGLMSANAGSEFTNSIAKTINESYKSLGYQAKVHILDKETAAYDHLAYSTIVVSLKKKSDVAYFIVLVEATGRKPVTADGIIKDIQSFQRGMNNIDNRYVVYTTDDAIDSVLHSDIAAILKANYGEDVRLISVEGLVLSHHSSENTWANIAALAYNSCMVELNLISGELNDLNITEANTKTPNARLKIDTAISRSHTKDLLEKPVRSDWRLELSLTANNNKSYSLNAKNSKATLVITNGFVDAIPEEIPLQLQYFGAPSQSVMRFRPHIITTAINTATPTVNFMLLGLITSTIMVNKNMWLPAINAKDNKNIGALNILANLNNEPQGLPLDLTNKKYSPQDVYNVVGQMFTMAPLFSVDIDNFGIGSGYSSVLAVAGDRSNRAREDAAKEIIEAAHWLTNGVFNKSYDVNKIFSFNAVPVPTGIWEDKSGIRDIRDIDTAFVAANGSVDLLNKWVFSNMPSEVSKHDPYIAKVEVIQALVPGAEITGKAFRLTFTDQFISELTRAAEAAGLDMSYEPEIRLNENMSFNIMTNYLNLGGITNVGNVAKENSSINGVNYHMQYSHMGRRY